MSGGFFENDSEALTGTSSQVLFKLASAMDLHPDMRLAIFGHTDSVGDFNYNVALSQRRADAVCNALLGEPYNVAPERLVAMGAGPISPVMENTSEEGRALNRRVEFVLLDDTVAAAPEETVTMPAQSTAEFAALVPENVMTPDLVRTDTLGELRFFDGMPLDATVEKTFDNLDLIRSTTAFLDGIKIASIQGLLKGYRDQGVQPNDVVIHAGLMDVRSVWLTPNTTTIYIAAQVDVSEGPVVIDAPAGLLGILDDAAFEYVTDIGAVGPDKSEGGKYLIVPKEYEGDLPSEGYFIFRTKTYDHWLILRGSPEADGSAAGPVAKIKAGLNIYHLSDSANPPAEVFHDLTGVR